jgi:hypothetical protein
MDDDFLNPDLEVPEFLFGRCRGDYWQDGGKFFGKFPTYTDEEYKNNIEKQERKRAYNKAVQEQIEEESMQEGKIGQRCIDPKRSLEYRAAMYRQTYKEIKNLPESLLGEPPYFSGEEI